MPRVEWSKKALLDLSHIYAYIERHNPQAALKLRQHIFDAVDKLPLFPSLFRLGRVAGTREYVVHPNYIVIYVVHAQTIDVLSVVHAKQKYPQT